MGGHLLVLCGLDGHGGLLGVGLLQVFHNEADWVIWLLYQESLHDLVMGNMWDKTRTWRIVTSWGTKLAGRHIMRMPYLDEQGIDVLAV